MGPRFAPYCTIGPDMKTTIEALSKATPLFYLIIGITLIIIYRKLLLRLFQALVLRVERGDQVNIGTLITIGRSVGPLKVPSSDGLVTDDHISLIHRSWRVPNRDAEFGGDKMYQIHVILFGPKETLDRVEYVVYRLHEAYPEPVKTTNSRKQCFELKELANGYSLLRAEVKVRKQMEMVNLSRFIDLTEVSEPLKNMFR